MSIEFMATLAATILSLIGWIIDSKKKSKKIKVARILKKLPDIILKCETENVPGKQKLATALLFIENECFRENIKYIEEEWKYEVEKILETPQKKQKETITNGQETT